MAYLNFAEPHDAALASLIARPKADPTPATLSPLEWSVVALAQRDRLSSIDRPGPVSIAMGRLFGGRRSPDLADPRLEALRRLAVIAWHRGYAVHSSEIHAFKAAGFSMAQYELVLASISRGRDARNQRAH
jgi:hypothetical protein